MSNKNQATYNQRVLAFLFEARKEYLKADCTMDFSLQKIAGRYNIGKRPKRIVEQVISKEITSDSVGEYKRIVNEYARDMERERKERMQPNLDFVIETTNQDLFNHSSSLSYFITQLHMINEQISSIEAGLEQLRFLWKHKQSDGQQ